MQSEDSGTRFVPMCLEYLISCQVGRDMSFFEFKRCFDYWEMVFIILGSLSQRIRSELLIAKIEPKFWEISPS